MDLAPAAPTARGQEPARGALQDALASLREARARIRFLEECGRRLVDAASDALVGIDTDGTIVDSNVRAEDAFGWARHELMGRKVQDLLRPSAGEPNLDDLARRLAGRTREGGSLRAELSARHRHGRCFPVEVTLAPGADPHQRVTYAFIHDLTQSRQDEAERRRLAAIVESSEEAIIGTDLDGRILTWNRGAQRLFGHGAADVTGEAVSVLVPVDAVEELSTLVHRVRRGEAVHQHETRGHRRNGVEIEVSLTMSPVCDVAGDLTGISIVARDITEQRWMASTLQSTLEHLEAALGEARESEARYRRFTADAAHQLRTPIAGIRACAETLLRDPHLDERETLLANVVRETARASRLMTGLLEVSRLDQGRTLAPIPCDILSLASSEVDRARAIAPGLQLSLVADIADDIRPEVDPQAVREILTNLLDNAHRHASRSVVVGVSSAGRHVQLAVADDGPGVPEGMEDRIFDRFVSVDGKGGSGLGLPIARALAEAHGGALVYAEAAFLLRLPCKAEIRCGGAGEPDFGAFEQPRAWESRAVP